MLNVFFSCLKVKVRSVTPKEIIEMGSCRTPEALRCCQNAMLLFCIRIQKICPWCCNETEIFEFFCNVRNSHQMESKLEKNHST